MLFCGVLITDSVAAPMLIVPTKCKNNTIIAFKRHKAIAGVVGKISRSCSHSHKENLFIFLLRLWVYECCKLSTNLCSLGLSSLYYVIHTESFSTLQLFCRGETILLFWQSQILTL